jgi:drug/metabolite transporter (DMT)-like permease
LGLGLGLYLGAQSLLLPKDETAWLFALFIGVVPGLLGLLGAWAALRHVPPVIMSISAPLEAPFAAFFAVMAGVGGVPGLYETLGGGIVLVSLTLAAYGNYKLERSVGQRPKSLASTTSEASDDSERLAALGAPLLADK